MNAMSIIHGSNNTGVEWASIFSIPIVFVLSLIIMLHRFRPGITGSQKYIVKTAKEEKLLTVEFLFSFVFPLFAFDFTKWESVVLFLFFFLLFGYLCTSHNYFCTNIMLDIYHYKIYSCELVDNHVTIQKKVISKRELTACCDDTIYAKGLNNDYFIDCSLPAKDE